MDVVARLSFPGAVSDFQAIHFSFSLYSSLIPLSFTQHRNKKG